MCACVCVCVVQVRLAKIQQESAVTVQGIKAEGELKVSKLEQQKLAVLSEMKAKANAEAQKTKAETVRARARMPRAHAASRARTPPRTHAHPLDMLARGVVGVGSRCM